MEVKFWKPWSPTLFTCVFFLCMMLGACKFDQFSSNALIFLQQTNQSYSPYSINNLCQKGYFKTNGIIAMKKHVKVQYFNLA